LQLTARLRNRLRAAGLRVPEGETAIVSLLVGGPEASLALAQGARARGVIAFPIRPPAVPVGTSRLRLTVSAGFSEQMVDRAADALVAAAHNGD
jgi:7-keto-8-aminopelargonate synthetase-like enzyme